MTPEEIKALRKTKGLTQEQLATMMQVDSTTIYRWENGIVTPSPFPQYSESFSLPNRWDKVTYRDLVLAASLEVRVE